MELNPHLKLGWSPLHDACFKGKTHVIENLLKYARDTGKNLIELETHDEYSKLIHSFSIEIRDGKSLFNHDSINQDSQDSRLIKILERYHLVSLNFNFNHRNSFIRKLLKCDKILIEFC